jgi:DNA-nicking Smr family endonuclease
MQDEFRKAVAGVHPLKRHTRIALRNPAPAPVPQQRKRDELAALAESLDAPLSVDDALDGGEELVYLRDGMGRQALRKLRRGHWVIQAGLDLHGMNRDEAAVAVAAFLNQCTARGLRCVRIVHGKGLGSRNREPVLKAKLRNWLPRRQEVLAYCQAPASDGGSGALFVLLKTKR